MGQVSTLLLEDWQRFQVSEWLQSEKHTIIKLPCCGASIELLRLEDQFVTCPNRLCGKRHMISWSLNPKVTSESKYDMLGY